MMNPFLLWQVLALQAIIHGGRSIFSGVVHNVMGIEEESKPQPVSAKVYDFEAYRESQS